MFKPNEAAYLLAEQFIGRVQQIQLLRTGSVSSLPLNDLEEYTNSNECSRIRSATVESAERDQYDWLDL